MTGGNRQNSEVEDKYIESLRPHKHQGQDNSYLSGGEKLNVTGKGIWKLCKVIGINIAKILFLKLSGGYMGLSILHKMFKPGNFNNIF